MATAITSALTFPIEPGLREALRTSVDREHRTCANMVAVMIRDYCVRIGVAIRVTGVLAVAKEPTKGSNEKTKSPQAKNKL